MGGTRCKANMFKSLPEIRAEALQRVTKRGHAYLLEAATILGWSDKRIRGDVEQGKIQTLQWGKRRVILLEELNRLRQEERGSI